MPDNSLRLVPSLLTYERQVGFIRWYNGNTNVPPDKMEVNYDEWM